MSDVKLFPFPSEVKQNRQRKKWIALLRRSNYTPKRWHRICSRHFVDREPTAEHPYPELFAYNGYKKQNDSRSGIATKRNPVVLNQNSVENQQPASATYSSESHVLLNDDLNNKTPFPLPVQNEEIVMISSISEDSNLNFKTDVPMRDHDYASRVNTHTDIVEKKDIEVQTDITLQDMSRGADELAELKGRLEDKDELRRTLLIDKITENDASVQKYLGIPSLVALFGLFEIIDKLSPVLKYWRGKSGTHHDTAYQEDSTKMKSGPKRKLTRFHEFILTLLRIRLAVPTFFLADLFGISQSRVSQIFATWINYLNFVFSPLLKWPKSNRIKKFIPN